MEISEEEGIKVLHLAEGMRLDKDHFSGDRCRSSESWDPRRKRTGRHGSIYIVATCDGAFFRNKTGQLSVVEM